MSAALAASAPHMSETLHLSADLMAQRLDRRAQSG